MFTIILMEGNTPKRAIGLFKTRGEAVVWAKADGWGQEEFRVIEINL